MRSFTDADGRRWDVVAGRESWGAVFAIFIPDESGGPTESSAEAVVRQAPLQATGYGEATAELDGLTEEELRAMLVRSDPKTTG